MVQESELYSCNQETKSELEIRKELGESVQKLKTQLQNNKNMITIGTNTAKIIHDIANLLTPITLIPTILRESLPDNSPWLDCCDSISGTIDQLNELNRQLTNLIDGSKDKIEIFDLNENLNEVLEIAKKFHLNNIDLETDLATRKFWVKGRTSQLFRVFLNLILNAKDALNGADSRIRITSKTEKFTPENYYRHKTSANGEFAKVTVEDNGTGISEQDLKYIFKPLFTIKNTKKQAGLGLGLSIVKDIIKEHHGHINVESSPGKGTRFSVYIPIV